MKFGVNEGMATKAGNFILGVVLVGVIVWAVCAAIKSSDLSSRQPQPQLRPSAMR